MSAKIELHTTSKQIRDIIGGPMYVVCEPRIFAYMKEFCPQYSHGSWQFASINGAPFMYPKFGTETVTLSNPNNYSENEVSPEAAGFAIALWFSTIWRIVINQNHCARIGKFLWTILKICHFHLKS